MLEILVSELFVQRGVRGPRRPRAFGYFWPQKYPLGEKQTPCTERI